ncbi:MAG: hypothetical protein L0Y71_06025 [Gemmataceae bacterium]|nr:hypothetical protein [Gemmataceae bacterium]
MPSPVRSSSSSREPSLPPVEVSYYRRMKMQRVYPFVVRWRRGAAPAPGERVTLRLLLAGAQVLPSEQTLDAGNPAAQATFFVTPLARGWLRGQRLEIVHHGRKVQELPLASKACTHRLTWALLLLTLLAPWFIHSYVRNSPFREVAAVDVNTGVKVIKENLRRENQVHDVDKAIRDNVPEMPGLIDSNLPQLNPALKDARHWTADTYIHIVNASQLQPYAFYGAMLFLVLTLSAAVTHRDVRRTRVGRPIPLASAAPAPAEAEAAAI